MVELWGHETITAGRADSMTVSERAGRLALCECRLSRLPGSLDWRPHTEDDMGLVGGEGLFSSFTCVGA